MWLKLSMFHVLCSEVEEEGELEQLRRQFDHSEAARHALEKRVKEAGSMQQRLIMACTVGSVLVCLHTSIALPLTPFMKCNQAKFQNCHFWLMSPCSKITGGTLCMLHSIQHITLLLRLA